ncbi:hypothetical protein HU200_055874 [Digitaria exilis]|uniref:DUF1618 domain-containing protein n=1 Tax=Digitaria exilis TaxID=1010633 RepID=A0A835AMZ0_9POAL|nr:hypothetical protein HU200_055874 [Digitaria exilis]
MPEPSSASRRPYFPDSVLLDPFVHLAPPLKNATTASTTTSALSPIEVSFEVVDPPGLSRCFVNCSALDAGDLSAPAVVTGADGAFLLIRVAFPRRDDREMHTDVFIYKAAGPGKPSLHLLPRPYPAGLYSDHVGVLSCGDGHYLVVVPERRFDGGGRMRYDLQVFSSETNSWTTRTARVASDLEGCYRLLPQHEPSKVFSVGDSLAWVATYLGVLLCDVLGKDPEMRLIDLPPLMPTNRVDLGGGFVAPVRSMRAARDVICKDGWIRCIEIEYPLWSNKFNPMEFRWTAMISKRNLFGSDIWEAFTVDSASLSPTSSCFPDLFPEIWDSSRDRLTLNRVISTAPILDAYHDNVVFMKTKLHPGHPNGWVLAVDTRNKKLVRAVPFSARKVYLNHSYLQCDFSKYLCKTLEERLSQKRSCYLEAQSLLHSGFASILYANIQEYASLYILMQLARYATSNGLGEVATEAVTVFLL